MLLGIVGEFAHGFRRGDQPFDGVITNGAHGDARFVSQLVDQVFLCFNCQPGEVFALNPYDFTYYNSIT